MAAMIKRSLRLRYRHVGGLRFLRIGRLQMSFCVCRRTSA
jgi:hypothetical protein